MCDYSLHGVKSRPAKIGDKLTTRDFFTCTRGFSASEDVSVVVCLRPGTELSFADEVRFLLEGQQATVLQLPAEAKTVSEAEARRATYVG